MPSSRFLTDGNQPLYLNVTISDGQVTGVAQTDAASANLVVTFKHRDRSGTRVEIASKLTVALKWDLYVSSDNQHYAYTSSCPRLPVANEFSTWEAWPHSVASLAISNFRVPADGKLTCS